MFRSILRRALWTGLGVALLALAVIVWGFWIEPRSLVVRHQSLTVAGLDQPVKVLLIGDLQPAGPHETPARLNAMMTTLRQHDVDLVVWVGDYVSERKLKTSFTHPKDTAKAMGLIKPPLGSWAVLGNHDWWYDGPAIEQLLQNQGITVLRDQNRVINTPGGDLQLVGLEDPVTHRPNLTRALAGVRRDKPTLMLTHTPDVFPDLPDHIDVTVAGHTHCGQVTFPFIGRPVVPSAYDQRFATGVHGQPGHQLVVTCGIGTSIIPVRFGNPPEAIILTLQP